MAGQDDKPTAEPTVNTPPPRRAAKGDPPPLAPLPTAAGLPPPAHKRRQSRFWRDALAWKGAVTPVVLPRVLAFGLYGFAVGVVHEWLAWDAIPAGPVHFTGGILALLLVLRTNAGYERWWEARKLWGGIVNQSRNLATAGLAYGPADRRWRQAFVRWTAAFCHVSRRSLRSQRELPELETLLGAAGADEVRRAGHMPSFVAQRLAALLHRAQERHQLGPWAFLAADRERALLIDHLGGCERILKTPLPGIHTIKLRRFIVIYLIGLPIAVADLWWVPGLVTLLVAYPLLAIDQIALELENPFSPHNLSHLPLDSICETIEGNLLGYLEAFGDAPLPVFGSDGEAGIEHDADDQEADEQENEGGPWDEPRPHRPS